MTRVPANEVEAAEFYVMVNRKKKMLPTRALYDMVYDETERHYTPVNHTKMDACWAIRQVPTTRWLWNPVKRQFQYDLYLRRTGKIKRYRPSIRRLMFLLKDPDLYFDSRYQVSHLCHNAECYNPEHLSFEVGVVNLARNGCPGPPGCRHHPLCLVAGPYSNLDRHGNQSLGYFDTEHIN